MPERGFPSFERVESHQKAIPIPGLIETPENLRVNFCYNYLVKKLKINIPKSRIAQFCQRWNVTELALFGSALRTDFRPDSDVDVMVTFAPDAGISLFEMVQMQDELKAIFGREVDLISKRGLEHSRNYLRRKAILESAQVIHVQG
jgi:uncharacterized protein